MNEIKIKTVKTPYETYKVMYVSMDEIKKLISFNKSAYGNICIKVLKRKYGYSEEDGPIIPYRYSEKDYNFIKKLRNIKKES